MESSRCTKVFFQIKLKERFFFITIPNVWQNLDCPDHFTDWNPIITLNTFLPKPSSPLKASNTTTKKNHTIYTQGKRDSTQIHMHVHSSLELGFERRSSSGRGQKKTQPAPSCYNLFSGGSDFLRGAPGETCLDFRGIFRRPSPRARARQKEQLKSRASFFCSSVFKKIAAECLLFCCSCFFCQGGVELVLCRPEMSGGRGKVPGRDLVLAPIKWSFFF